MRSKSMGFCCLLCSAFLFVLGQFFVPQQPEDLTAHLTWRDWGLIFAGLAINQLVVMGSTEFFLMLLSRSCALKSKWKHVLCGIVVIGIIALHHITKLKLLHAKSRLICDVIGILFGTALVVSCHLGLVWWSPKREVSRKMFAFAILVIALQISYLAAMLACNYNPPIAVQLVAPMLFSCCNSYFSYVFSKPVRNRISKVILPVKRCFQKARGQDTPQSPRDLELGIPSPSFCGCLRNRRVSTAQIAFQHVEMFAAVPTPEATPVLLRTTSVNTEPGMNWETDTECSPGTDPTQNQNVAEPNPPFLLLNMLSTLSVIPEANEIDHVDHPGDVDAHPGDADDHPGDVDDHPRAAGAMPFGQSTAKIAVAQEGPDSAIPPPKTVLPKDPDAFLEDDVDSPKLERTFSINTERAQSPNLEMKAAERSHSATTNDC